MYTHTYIHTHIHSYIHTYMCTYTHIHIQAYRLIHTCTHTYIHIYTWKCMHADIHTRADTHTHIYIHLNRHVRTYVRTYTHTHTHTHTQLNINFIYHSVSLDFRVSETICTEIRQGLVVKRCIEPTARRSHFPNCAQVKASNGWECGNKFLFPMYILSEEYSWLPVDTIKLCPLAKQR